MRYSKITSEKVFIKYKGDVNVKTKRKEVPI